MVFYRRIKELRDEAHLSQKRMAAQLGISQQAYCKYELGITEPSLTTILKIADILEVSLDYLFGRVEKHALLWVPSDETL